MPLYAVADFCLIPMGTGSTSVGKYIAECQKVLESMKDQGIKYEMHGYGTNVEGSYDVVMKAIERCHEEVSRGWSSTKRERERGRYGSNV